MQGHTQIQPKPTISLESGKKTSKSALADIAIDEQAFLKLETVVHESDPWNKVPGLNIILMKGPADTAHRGRRFSNQEWEADASNLSATCSVCDAIMPCQLSYMLALGNPITDWGDYVAHGSHNWQKFNDSIYWSYSQYKGKEIVSIVKKDKEGNLIQRTDYHDWKRVNQVHVLQHSVDDGKPLQFHENPKKVSLLHDILCETISSESKDKPTVLGIHCAGGIGRTGIGVTGSLAFLRHSELAAKLPSDLPADPVKLVEWLRTSTGRKLILATLSGENNLPQFKDAVELAKALELEHEKYLAEGKPRQKVSSLVQLTEQEEQAVMKKIKSMQKPAPLAKTLFVFDIDKTHQEDGSDKGRFHDKFMMILKNGGEVALHTRGIPGSCGTGYYVRGFNSKRVTIAKQDDKKIVETILNLVKSYSNISQVVFYHDDNSVTPHFEAIAAALKKEGITFCHRPYSNPQQLEQDLATSEYKNNAANINPTTFQKKDLAQTVSPNNKLNTGTQISQGYIATRTLIPPPNKQKQVVKNPDEQPSCVLM